jgi:hypothetical protein
MRCTHCGNDINEGQAFCQYCGARVEQLPADVATGRGKTPWENRDVLGSFRSLVATIKEALFSPSAFFRRMPVSGGLTDPLLYSLIVSMAGTMVSFLWDMVLRGTFQQFLPAEMSSAPGYDLFAGVGIAAMAVLLPLFLIAVLFIEAGIYHLLLLLVRGGKAGFEGTFRAVAYGNSGSVFMMVPFCGSIVGIVWSIVITIIGLKEAHETTGGKAAFAVLMPLVLCCGVVLVLSLVGVLAVIGTMANQ